MTTATSSSIKLLKVTIHTVKTNSITTSINKRKLVFRSTHTINVPTRKLLVKESQHEVTHQDLATQNLRCPPMDLVVPTGLSWPEKATMPDQQRSEAGIMSSKVEDPDKVATLRQGQLHQNSTTTPLDPQELPKKLFYALTLRATAASKTRLLTSRTSMVVIALTSIKPESSGEVDLTDRQEMLTPKSNSTLYLVVSVATTNNAMACLTVGE